MSNRERDGEPEDPLAVVVDDDMSCLEFMSLMLEMKGFKVKKFSAPLNGLAYLKEYPNKVDLLLTDYDMPIMLGSELISKAYTHLKVNPNIWLCSAGITPSSINPLVKEFGVRYASKPLDMGILIRCGINASQRKRRQWGID